MCNFLWGSLQNKARGVDLGSSQCRVGLGTERVGGLYAILLKKTPKSEQKWFENFYL